MITVTDSPHDYEHDLDPLDRLRDLRPDTMTLEHDWPAAERAAMLHRLHDDDGSARAPRFVTRRRTGSVRHVAVPAAVAGLAALAAGLLVAVLPSGSGDGGGNGLKPLGEPFSRSRVENTPRVGPGQYAYRATSDFETVKGRLVVSQTTEDWVAPDGAIVSRRRDATDPTKNACYRFPDGTVSQRSLDALPTDAGALEAQLRRTVSGSTSREEAIFVNVGDVLRDADLLATSTLRVAYVEVLSRTGGVAVHRDVTDSRGRPAVRADFVDPNNRPGQVSSLYFDAHTFQLLEEATSTSAPTPYRSQSYDKAPPAASTPDRLPAPTGYTAVTSEKVVDSVPASLANCPAN